ncbi:MAG TPA: hypothetical protein VD999_03755 [Vitreimonas sp.]|nr:hypothetical protein [Vitreimonas sp.]
MILEYPVGAVIRAKANNEVGPQSNFHQVLDKAKNYLESLPPTNSTLSKELVLRLLSSGSFSVRASFSPRSRLGFDAIQFATSEGQFILSYWNNPDAYTEYLEKKDPDNEDKNEEFYHYHKLLRVDDLANLVTSLDRIITATQTRQDSGEKYFQRIFLHNELPIERLSTLVESYLREMTLGDLIHGSVFFEQLANQLESTVLAHTTSWSSVALDQGLLSWRIQSPDLVYEGPEELQFTLSPLEAIGKQAPEYRLPDVRVGITGPTTAIIQSIQLPKIENQSQRSLELALERNRIELNKAILILQNYFPDLFTILTFNNEIDVIDYTTIEKNLTELHLRESSETSLEFWWKSKIQVLLKDLNSNQPEEDLDRIWNLISLLRNNKKVKQQALEKDEVFQKQKFNLSSLKKFFLPQEFKELVKTQTPSAKLISLVSSLIILHKKNIDTVLIAMETVPFRIHRVNSEIDSAIRNDKEKLVNHVLELLPGTRMITNSDDPHISRTGYLTLQLSKPLDSQTKWVSELINQL